MKFRKYYNKPVTIDGIKFDSGKEGEYYKFLKELESAGKISDLRLQVEYELLPAIWEDRIVHLKTKDKTERHCVQRPTFYKADFVYFDNDSQKEVVVDVKGDKKMITKDFILKRKMMRALKGIDVTVVV